jgi:hypothetical protein
MFSSRSSNGYSSINDGFIYTLLIFQMMLIATCNSNEFFTSHEIEKKKMQQSMDMIVGVQ